MSTTDTRRYWSALNAEPDMGDNDKRRLWAYVRGDAYTFNPPDVCTARWGDRTWSRCVRFTSPLPDASELPQ